MNLANALAWPLKMSGMPVMVRRRMARNAVTILVYHDPSTEVFDRHLGWLKAHYRIVPIDDACAALGESKLTELGEYPLVLTIDDGHIGNAALLPIIRKHRVRPCIYLCSAIVGTKRPITDCLVSSRFPRLRDEYKRQDELGRRTMFLHLFGMDLESELDSPMTLGLEDIRRMSKYVDFGSHGRFHQSMPYLSDDDLNRELVVSKQEIEAMTGRSCDHFSFPSGLYDERCVRAIRDAGYKSSRTTLAGWNNQEDDVFSLKVTGASDDASIAKLNVQSSGIYRLIKQCLRGYA